MGHKQSGSLFKKVKNRSRCGVGAPGPHPLKRGGLLVTVETGVVAMGSNPEQRSRSPVTRHRGEGRLFNGSTFDQSTSFGLEHIAKNRPTPMIHRGALKTAGRDRYC
ncbi:hypothetical protein XENOCAPTIV_027317 [Xenoophorus captivus]|uniref:Uncharacterized protein n=1 Tax=Xenoophorus captivus TaxID=1517983 RepID=A0ABV0RV23_9TELE